MCYIIQPYIPLLPACASRGPLTLRRNQTCKRSLPKCLRSTQLPHFHCHPNALKIIYGRTPGLRADRASPQGTRIPDVGTGSRMCMATRSHGCVNNFLNCDCLSHAPGCRPLQEHANSKACRRGTVSINAAEVRLNLGFIQVCHFYRMSSASIGSVVDAENQVFPKVCLPTRVHV